MVILKGELFEYYINIFIFTQAYLEKNSLGADLFLRVGAEIFYSGKEFNPCTQKAKLYFCPPPLKNAPGIGKNIIL